MLRQRHIGIALSLLVFGLERAATGNADEFDAEDVHSECLSLIQRTAGLKDRLGIRTAPSAQEAHPDGALFQKALVVSIEPNKYTVTAQELKDMGVPAEMVRGYDGRMPSEVIEALQLLKEYGNAASLHSTVSNWMVCMHTSPGKPPNLGAAMSELWSNLFRMSPRNDDELLQHDHHGCVPKVIAIAAAHVRLWRDLASGKLPTQGASSEGDPDPWYLVMEDDVVFCPGWRERMQRELPLAPADAEVIKLFFFGHWRAEDQVGNSSLPGPFLEAKDPLRGWDLVTSALYELLHGAGWSKVPAAGFYAGTQAYLIRPSGARKLLENIRGKPFQDIDMTMMSSVKNYVWRRVLVRDRPDDPKPVSLLQTVPTCNAEPPKDQFR